MNSKNWLGLLLSFSVLVALGLTSGCGKPADPVKCDSFNNKQSECEKAKENDKQCVYDLKTKKCALPAENVNGKDDKDKDDKPDETVEGCAKLDEKACQISDQCTYDESTKKCGDAPADLKGTCGAIEDGEACEAQAKCEWLEGSCMDKPTEGEIFTWTKANLPDGATIANISHFTQSGDKSHMYAYSKATNAAKKGLYYSIDSGTTWKRVGPKDATTGAIDPTGMLSAMPFAGRTQAKVAYAANVVNLDTAITVPELMIPTEKGLVLVAGKLLIMLEGNSPVFGVDTYANADSGWAVRSWKIDGLKNQEITFASVLHTHIGETLMFGQKDANTVFFRNTSGNLDIKGLSHFKTRKTDGTELKQIWTKAGNNNDDTQVLLATANGTWSFPINNTDILNTTGFGIVSNNAPIADANIWKSATKFSSQMDFSGLAANKNEMMADKSPVDVLDATDLNQITLFGDDNTTVLWVKTKGIFLRAKTTGLPRS